MLNKNKCLLCCDSHEEWMELKKICGSDHVTATNNYEFFKEIKEQETGVFFLESDEGNPYEIIWDILDQIHNIIDDGRVVDKFLRLFHLSYHVEGGFPTKMAQMIINLNLISNIANDNDIKEIYIYDNAHNWIINESIFLYSRSREIKCHIFDPYSTEEKSSLKTLEAMEGEIENFISKELTLKETEKFEYFSKTSEKKYRKKTVNTREDVGILYCLNILYRKHVDWVMRRIDAIGHDARVICFYDTEAVAEFRGRGLKADCLEEYFEKDVFINAYENLKRERTAVLKRLAERLKVSYDGTDLSGWLLIKIRNHYFRELLEYLYMDVCASNYFKQRSFAYIHAWGDSEFWQTWICYDNTRDADSKLFEIDCIGLYANKRRLQFPDMISVMFTPSIDQLCQSLVTDFPGNVFSVRDSLWGGKSSAVEKPLSGGKKNKIGIFPSGVLKGFTTYRFYYGTWMPLVDMLLELHYEIIFKNHPALRECWEEDMEAKYKDREGVVFLPSDERIEKALECCELVITDISSVIFDAALSQKAVFCIVDNSGYDMIKQHTRGFSIYQCTEELLEEIENVSQNDERYKSVLDKQNTYMEEITGNRSCDRNESIYTLLQSVE